MAFKMKGSPAKMGKIQGTTGHSSALKMKMEDDAAAKMKESPNKFILPALRAGAQYLLGKGKKEAVKKGTDVVKNVVKTTKKTKKTKPKATNVDDVTKTTTKTTTKQPTKKELQKQLEDQKKQIDELLNKTDISTQLFFKKQRKCF